MVTSLDHNLSLPVLMYSVHLELGYSHHCHLREVVEEEAYGLVPHRTAVVAMATVAVAQWRWRKQLGAG